MTTTTHTPGPWRIRENARHSQDQCDLTICGDIFQLADINGPQYAHQIANANLIAAAPELLAAIAELLRQTANPDPLHPAWRKARANATNAYNKATGQAVQS